MTDAAPVSSRHVRHTLIRHGMPSTTADHLEITTEIHHQGRRAVTSVQRPIVRPRTQQNECDREVEGILRTLPGADASVVIEMGRRFIVTWDGICAPI